MSRKQDLLSLMNIDISWMKKKSQDEAKHISFDDLELESKYCNKCSLSETRNNVVFGKGSQEAKILIIGEAPGRDEDQTGEPFIGRAGKLLNEILFSKLTREQIYITNTVKCRPPENRNPHSDEIKSCSGFLDSQINYISPKIIILLGKVVAESIMNTLSP